MASQVSAGADSASSRQYLKGREDRSDTFESLACESLDRVGWEKGQEELTDFRNSLSVNLGSKANRLRSEKIHHLRSSNTIWESWAVVGTFIDRGGTEGRRVETKVAHRERRGDEQQSVRRARVTVQTREGAKDAIEYCSSRGRTGKE